jgi:hypothetical protein
MSEGRDARRPIEGGNVIVEWTRDRHVGSGAHTEDESQERRIVWHDPV